MIFVGHSYGGVVITEAGNDPKVIELVYVAAFAPDLDAEKAAFIADSQVPWGVDALRGTISKAAWRTKPSWYLVASEDQMIPPPRLSVSCPSVRVRLSSRLRAVAQSTSRSRMRWPRSSKRLPEK